MVRSKTVKDRCCSGKMSFQSIEEHLFLCIENLSTYIQFEGKCSQNILGAGRHSMVLHPF